MDEVYALMMSMRNALVGRLATMEVSRRMALYDHTPFMKYLDLLDPQTQCHATDPDAIVAAYDSCNLLIRAARRGAY